MQMTKIQQKQQARLDFTPTHMVCASKAYHYLYLVAAIVLPVALLVFTLVKGTFAVPTVLICLAIAVVFLGLDLFTSSNLIFYDDERIALIGSFLEKPVYYRWDACVAVYYGNELARLEFSDSKPLEFNRKYEGAGELEAYAEARTSK